MDINYSPEDEAFRAEVRTWLRELGPDRMVLAFDVRLDASGTPVLNANPPAEPVR